MYINHDDLTAIASGSAAQSDFILKSMDRELLTLKRIVSLILLIHSAFIRALDQWRHLKCRWS